MKKSITVVIFLLLIFGFTGITSCKSCKNRAEEEKIEQKTVELEQMKSLEGEIEKNVYPLPTSAEVIEMLQELEVGYIIGISNPVANSKKYFSSRARAINLGVYGADLSYATLYNMNQEVINYLEAIRILANELNMSKIYDETLYDRIKENFDKRDELVSILTDAFNETYEYLSDNDQQPLALLVVGGAWVEGMYLTTHVSEAAYQIAGIARVLLEQKSSFELFLEITKPYIDDPDVSNFVSLLDPIKKVYEGLGTSLTNQNIIDITNAIGGIRSQIIL